MKRMTLQAAMDDLSASARCCRKCSTLYVGGRKGNVFCSELCARAAAQAAYRAKQRVKASGASSLDGSRSTAEPRVRELAGALDPLASRAYQALFEVSR